MIPEKVRTGNGKTTSNQQAVGGLRHRRKQRRDTSMKKSIILSLAFAMIIGPAFGFKEADLNQLSNSEYCVKCDLSGADLGGARLYGHNLSGADLREANLFRAYLGEANLSYADVSGASLDFATLG